MPDKIQVITRPRKEVETLMQHLQLDIDDDGVLDMGEVKLVLNRKQDAYYTVKREACSCPDYLYRQSAKGERCKHMALFDRPEPREDAMPVMSLRESIWEAEAQDNARSRARGGA